MALSTPTLYTRAAFDATQSATFTFNVLGGSQVVKNQLFIVQGETIIYNGFNTTYSFTHVLPADTLENGEQYTAYIVTYDAQNNSSLPSNSITFYCYTEPSFTLGTIDATTSSIEFTVTYSQEENETLSSYEFNLYDVNLRRIATSGIINTGNPIIPSGGSLSYSYTFGGFINNAEYYIEVTGRTAGNTAIATGKEYFIILYKNPSVYQILTLTNNCNTGNITIQSQATAIIGKSNPDPATYVDDNTAIDLTDEDSWVKWDESFEIAGNWTIGLWGRSLSKDKPIFTMSNSLGQRITIELISTGTTNQYKARLYVESPTYEYGYVIFSNTISITNDSQEVNIWVRKIDNIYDIKIANLG